MQNIGMIFQYNQDTQSGQIMFMQGDKRSFTKAEWVDTENTPAVGKKVAYRVRDSAVEVSMVAQERDITELNEAAGDDEVSDISVEDYIAHYLSKGYKKAKESIEGGDTRVVAMRLYTPSDYGETIIREKNGKITLKQMLNGQDI